MAEEVLTLGIDFSTQSVKIVLLDVNKREIVYTSKFEYDAIFPEYGTSGGILPSDNPDIKHTSPFMLIESLDFLFDKLQNDGMNLKNIKAIKVDAMQHCSVYTNKKFEEKIRNLDPEMDLIYQLKGCLSRKRSPIWEDRSTTEEAKVLEERLSQFGGAGALT